MDKAAPVSRWDSNPLSPRSASCGRRRVRAVTWDSYTPAVTAHARHGPLTSDAVRPSADRHAGVHQGASPFRSGRSPMAGMGSPRTSPRGCFAGRACLSGRVGPSRWARRCGYRADSGRSGPGSQLLSCSGQITRRNPTGATTALHCPGHADVPNFQSSHSRPASLLCATRS